MTKLPAMKPLIYLLISLFIIDSISAETTKQITAADCRDDERFVECGKCEATCDNFNPKCTTECRPAMCLCEIGKIRNSTGACIYSSQCDGWNPCGQNESLTYRGERWCFASCRDPNPPCLQTNIFGGEKCECAKGFIRNNSRKCILQSECPKDVDQCGENETLMNCPCEPTCQDPDKTCYKGAICPDGKICQCSQGFLRNDAGKCVKQSECSKNFIFILFTNAKSFLRSFINNI